MSLQPVYDAIQDIKVHPGRKDKEKLFKFYLNSLGTDFYNAFWLAYNPFLKFHVNKFEPKPVEKKTPNKDIFHFLQFLSEKTGTNNQDKEHLETISSGDEGTFYVVKGIVRGDLECGVGIKTVQKFIPELPQFDVMLAEKNTEKNRRYIKFPAIAEIKEDGARSPVIVQKGKPTFYSRNGREANLLGYFDECFGLSNNIVYDAEIIFFKNGKQLPRKKSNGLFNKALKGTLKPEEVQGAQLRVWDQIPLEDFKKGYCPIGCEARMFHNPEAIKALEIGWKQNKVSFVKHEVVYDWDEVNNFLKRALEDGQEGIILKNKNSPYEAKRSHHWVKYKNEFECDLICVGIKEHTKKKGWIGSLICQSGDGKLEVDVGTGLDDKDRQKPHEEYLNKIIGVSFNEIIESDGNKKPSLYLPVFQGDRLDKDEADTYEQIKEIQEAN